MSTPNTCSHLAARWIAIFLIVSVVANPAFAKVDEWDVSQKKLIVTCEDWNRWLDLLVPALEQYKNALGSSVPEQAQRANVQRFLDSVDGLKCTQDSQLNEKKELADLLLRPINIVKALSKLWVAGTQLYGLTIQLIFKSLSGEPEVIPFGVINAALDFLIEAAKAAGNKESAKTLQEIKKLKEAVEKGKESLDKLKEAVEKLQQT
ncbi:MAG: hypothetical protein FD165_567 [Gammaproteobacteria bacterium]|nr:MAG: hypothetical protein FD165_567 [Gammaproteobacteria bacterium]TND02171.1 MAG: hypothetical protein FD120_2335 [Gammaproteobacteria bacterium]